MFVQLFKYFPYRYACVYNYLLRFESANYFCSELITLQRLVQELHNI